MRNNVFRKCCAVFLLILMLSAVTLGASALAAVTDLTRKGSITVTVKDSAKKEPIPGGTMTVIPVCTVNESGYVYTTAFKDCTVSLDNPGSADTAKAIDKYAKDNNITGTSKLIDSKGTVEFKDLPLGMYLILQTRAAIGYDVLQPFLVTVPVEMEGHYVYDVNATPKAGEASKTPTTPTSSSSSSSSSGSSSSQTTLPQTGQLIWPIPILAFCGTASLLIGLKRRKDSNYM